jgi:alpha-amylase/alpha-mannosidase (GH57 family)
MREEQLLNRTQTLVGLVNIAVHGHFYQPPREDPFTGIIPEELGAAPFRNFNEKITAECYRPNAEAGNFDVMSFNLGPTLACWLEKAHPEVPFTGRYFEKRASQQTDQSAKMKD